VLFRSLSVAELDNPVAKDFFGRPVIPGSSFKGALRNQVESLIRGLGRSDLWSCDLFESPCPRPPDSFEPGLAERRRDRERHWLKAVREMPLAGQVEASCTVCRLFGSTWFGSKVVVPDLSVSLSSWDNRFFQYRDGSAIDRETDTAAETRKVEFEVVPPGTVFSLEMIVENPQEGTSNLVDEVGLILAGLETFNSGWSTLGGRRAFGLGRVAIHIDSLHTLTPKGLLAGTPPTTVIGSELASVLAGHQARLAKTLTEGSHVSNPA
jgi:CRISPR-associated RAMP protein (TIGR02581 family)